MESVYLETMRDLPDRMPHCSTPGPVYQPDQQSSDACHPVSTSNADGDDEVRSRQLSHDEYSSKQFAADDLLGIGSQHLPVYNVSPMASHEPPTTLAPQMVLPSYFPPLPNSNQMGFPGPYRQPQYLDYPYPPSTGAPLSSHYGPVSQDPSMMYSIPPVMQTGGTSYQHDNQKHVRVVQSRPRPQCWEHGCNGRQFFTFSNLLRHQREFSGQAGKATYPSCGAEFTRTTARNGHLLHQNVRQKRIESIAVIGNGGQLQKVLEKVDMEHQGQHNNPSRSRPPFSFSRSPSAPVPTAIPGTDNDLSALVRQVFGEPADPLSGLIIVKEEPLSSDFTAFSSPHAATSPHSTLNAEDGLFVEQSRLMRAALVRDNIRGPTPEDIPCDMSDMSDGESFETSSASEGPSSPISLAESRRKILIDRTISWLITWIDSRLGMLAFQAHGTHGEGHRESPWPQTETQGASNGVTQENRKGHQKGGRGPGDEDSDGENCAPPPSQDFGTADNDEALEFACPFLKHNPRKYKKIRSCSASGWKSIHRLKEHLYRCHLLPLFQCIRCRMAFKSSEQLLQHSQAEIACDVVRDDSGQEGISQEQVMKLKSRKRNRGVISDHEKWIHVYRILFPGDYLIPSPYFQRSHSGDGQESFLTALREHVGRELPRLMRPRLEESVDATIRDALGPNLLEGLVRDILGQILNTFSWQTPEDTTTKPNVRQEDIASHTAGRFPQLALARPGSDDLAFHSVPTFGGEQNASAAGVFNQQGTGQPESSQRASQSIDDEAMGVHKGWGNFSEMELKPLNPSVDVFPYLSPTITDNTGGGSVLSDFLNFEAFHDECAAWLGQSEESSSHADSGYSSLQFVDKMENTTEKGKGKEVIRDQHS